MIPAARIDDQRDAPDRMSAEFDSVREQLNAIEAALPDYGPSFSELEMQTRQINSAIDKIAASPSIKLSPAEHASKSAHAISELLAPSLVKLQKADESAEYRQTELVRLTNTLHVRSIHRPFPWMWPVIALVAEFWLYPLVAVTVPGGTNLAALAAGHRSPWAAGGSLMHAHNPEAWAGIGRASQVLAGNREAFAACLDAADRKKVKQACTNQVGPAAGQK